MKPNFFVVLFCCLFSFTAFSEDLTDEVGRVLDAAIKQKNLFSLVGGQKPRGHGFLSIRYNVPNWIAQDPDLLATFTKSVRETVKKYNLVGPGFAPLTLVPHFSRAVVARSRNEEPEEEIQELREPAAKRGDDRVN